MQQSGAQWQIGWLVWFSDLGLQLELVQELQMRQIKGAWWQLGVGASCGWSLWVVLGKWICPWGLWNRPAFKGSSEEPLGIWCPAAAPHKDPQLLSKSGRSNLWLEKGNCKGDDGPMMYADWTSNTALCPSEYQAHQDSLWSIWKPRLNGLHQLPQFVALQ